MMTAHILRQPTAGHPARLVRRRRPRQVLDGLRSNGLNTVGEVQDYEETFRLCYVRGPEGIIIELAEQISSNATA
jgi:hypothetical protein